MKYVIRSALVGTLGGATLALAAMEFAVAEQMKRGYNPDTPTGGG